MKYPKLTENQIDTKHKQKNIGECEKKYIIAWCYLQYPVLLTIKTTYKANFLTTHNTSVENVPVTVLVYFPYHNGTVDSRTGGGSLPLIFHWVCMLE